jgi:hypothetical protein
MTVCRFGTQGIDDVRDRLFDDRLSGDTAQSLPRRPSPSGALASPARIDCL